MQRTQTIDEYRAEQGLPEYDDLAHGWRQLILKKKSSGPTVGKPSKRSLELFFMTCYDIDRFRSFVASDSFSGIYDLPADELHAMLLDDVTLLQFGFRFLRQVLFGEETIALRQEAASYELGFDAVNSNTFQDQSGQKTSYKFGSLTHASKATRDQAIEHNIECIEIGQKLGSTALTVWIADGANFPGQTNLNAAFDRYMDSLKAIYDKLPRNWFVFLEHKLYEPAFYATVISDWGSSFMAAQELGPKAKCLVDLGHHAPNTNIEQIVARLIRAEKLAQEALRQSELRFRAAALRAEMSAISLPEKKPFPSSRKNIAPRIRAVSDMGLGSLTVLRNDALRTSFSRRQSELLTSFGRDDWKKPNAVIARPRSVS